MYIDKLAPIIEKITNYQWYDELEKELQMAMELKDNKKAAELLEIMQNKEDEERAEAEKQYTESFSDNPNRIFQDFQEVIDGLTQQNFETWFETTKKHFPHIFTTSDKWAECCEYIRRLSAVQLRVIEHYGLDIQKAYQAIAGKAAKWYEPPELKEEKKAISITVPTFNAKFLLMAYNKAAVAMATMDSKGLKTDIAGNMIIETKGVKIQIANFADISAAFNISTSKLLIAGIICFTQLNNIGDMRHDRTKTEILLPVEEYALRCGYDVEEHPTNTQEEKQKEKNRVKNLLKYVRKEIDKDLELLYNASVSFKTNNGDYTDIRIITKKGITNRGKYIQMRFEEDFAKSLKVCRISMFPVNLFKVKNPVAYRIGVAMSNHYNNDNNLIAGTADRMKIETLLEYSGLPTIDRVRETRKSWRDKIQKPFEDALEILHHENMLDNYSYVKTGGIEISELNADSDYYKIDADYQFSDFVTWAGLLVKFKLHEAIDHTERIEQKKAAKEEAKADKKKKVGRPKKEVDSNTPTVSKRKRGRPKKTES